MYKRVIAAVAVAAGVALALTAWHAKGASAQSGSQSEANVAPTIAQIQQMALLSAANDGQSVPANVEEASSTLGQVAHAIDPQDGTGPTVTDPRTGNPWAESPVYVVTMQGHFTYNGPTPRRGKVPTGTVLTIAIDAQSGDVVAESLGGATPDLHAISPTVTTLGG